MTHLQKKSPTMHVKRGLPDFLVIGGMKCATTTLYEDLRLNPNFFLPGKELNVLIDPDSDASLNYLDLFGSAKETQIRGDVSTEYSMLPRHPDVAQRAFDVLGDELKIVYLVRNPVERALSHHMHTFNTHGASVIGDDVNVEVRLHEDLINFSKYAFQLGPWVERFGKESIKVIRFEDYTANRSDTISEVCEFLGVMESKKELNEHGANRGDTRAVAKGLWTRVLASGWYRNGVRKLMPSALRNKMRDAVLAKPELRKIPPSIETIEFLIESLKNDADELAKMLDWPVPIWDFEKTRLRYSNSIGKMSLR